jgi:hypothetical protein
VRRSLDEEIARLERTFFGPESAPPDGGDAARLRDVLAR